MIPAAVAQQVCMYTPARKSPKRRLAFLAVRSRRSGPPRSQFLTR